MALDRAGGHTGGGTAVVIGAGGNGLVAAAALARRGTPVTVLERAPVPGGMAAGAGGPAELAGFVRGPHAAALAELGLSRDDLRLVPPLPTVALDPEGRHVVIAPGRPALGRRRAAPGCRGLRSAERPARPFARVLARRW
jgi:phytoene dehydrogenase-like protein